MTRLTVQLKTVLLQTTTQCVQALPTCKWIVILCPDAVELLTANVNIHAATVGV